MMTLLKKAPRKTARIVIASSNPEIDPKELLSGIAGSDDVKQFTSGEDAYDWCNRNPDRFDFCLVGVDLEDMTGITLAYRLRRDLEKEVLLIVDVPESEIPRVRDYTLRAEVIPAAPDAMEKIRKYAERFKTTGSFAELGGPGGIARFEQVSRLTAGTQVKDYRLVAPVAVGGMGMVWEAFEKDDRTKRIAIKFLSSDWRNNARVTEMFRHEARLLSAMSHESLLPVLSSGCWSSYEFIAFPFIDGGTGQVILDSAVPLPMEIAGHIGSKLLSVLDYVHSFELESQPLGIEHRDINPSNLLFSMSGEMFLIDFGGAKSAIQKSTFDGRKVKISIVAQGDPGYEAPEQRKYPVSPRNSQIADLYSAGLVIYRMFVPRLYRDEESYELEPLPGDATEFQRSFFTRILAEGPENRFQSAREANEVFLQAFPLSSNTEFKNFTQHLFLEGRAFEND